MAIFDLFRRNRQADESANALPYADDLPVVEPIGTKQVQTATEILRKYKSGKANLEQRIITDEQWYKMRHWDQLKIGDNRRDQVKPASGWLFNAILNKHADAMDNYPEPIILPREQDDEAEAQMLSDIIPVVLEENDFEQTYSDVWNYKLKCGTGIYGVFWDGTKLNGLGDITVKKIDVLNLFWQPGITDIQQSKHLFNVELVDNETLIQRYPQLNGKLNGNGLTVEKYIYDDTVDTTDMSAVVDWYYKRNVNGKMILHYCKYVNDIVLYATENDPELSQTGLYGHGKYPFVFDVMYPVEGSPAGFGLIDVGKDAQEYIDRGNQAILQSMLVNARPRFFIRSDGAVNEAEFADMNNSFVHVDGTLGDESIKPMINTRLDGIYVNVINNKIDEMKEVLGFRDIATGGTASGVTAASAIAALQEQSGKTSRDIIKASYRAYSEIIRFCIELIRQFYDSPRTFRILGEMGMARYVSYTNKNISAQPMESEYGYDFGARLPEFDIKVSAQKQSPYSKMSQNELALQFYTAGFFAPGNEIQALTCLGMMDFDGKEEIMQKISDNSLMQQMMLQQRLMQPQAQVPPEEVSEMPQEAEEPTLMRNARMQSAETTAPR